MSMQDLIVLEHLRAVSTEKGSLELTNVKVKNPCRQPNAAGSLSDHSSLEAFREDARASGAELREALIATSV